MATKNKKNFSYGDLWSGKAIVPDEILDKPRQEKEPELFTSNKSFINYLKENNYRVFLDWKMRDQVAYTNIDRKEIILNAYYPQNMLEVFMQHELGHLMLFDVNQFTTVKSSTLRSIITKEIYNPKYISKISFPKLLMAENIIQDIVIETTSIGNCVCATNFALTEENLGVKHLDHLESLRIIASEAMENLCKFPEKINAPDSHPDVAPLLDSMMDDLKKDMEETDEEVKKTQESDEFAKSEWIREQNKKRSVSGKINRIDKQLNKKRITDEKRKKLKDIKKRLENELDELNSKKARKESMERAQEKKQKALDKLNKAQEKNRELLESLKEVRDSLPEPNGHNSDGEVSPDLQKNYTDHLADDDVESTGGHSCDCGFPNPKSISRDDSEKNEKNLKNLSSSVRNIKKIELTDEDFRDDYISSANKIPENEFTYFRSNKREISPTDMLKGKRRLRVSGINILVGLDVSGSMTNEWTKMFSKISSTVDSFKDEFDIDRIIYFTYHHSLKEVSENVNDLTLAAGGGNAFGYVYQELMKSLPVMAANEIILVTDCGDNLGFDLNKVCVLERNGVEIKNHISIIDTEEAGFYDKGSLDSRYWSMHYFSDPNLISDLKDNIVELGG